MLVVDIPAVGSYWLVVGSEPGIEEEGEYELTISCVDTLAADANTTTIGCAETVFGTTGSGVNGGSGQRVYELELDEPSGVRLGSVPNRTTSNQRNGPVVCNLNRCTA